MITEIRTMDWDISILTTSKELQGHITPFPSSFNSKWSVGLRRADYEPTLMGNVLNPDRSFHSSSGEVVRVIELSHDRSIQDLNKYSGTAVVADHDNSLCMGMLIEATHSQWLHSMFGIKESTGTAFALDIFDILSRLRDDPAAKGRLNHLPTSISQSLTRASEYQLPELRTVYSGRYPYIKNGLSIPSFIMRKPWITRLYDILETVSPKDQKTLCIDLSFVRESFKKRAAPDLTRSLLEASLREAEIRQRRARTNRGERRRIQRNTWDKWRDMERLCTKSIDVILPVIGRFGAGKSRLLYETFEACSAEDIPFVHLALNTRETLDRALFKGIGSAFHLPVESFRDVDFLMKRTDAPCLIAIDDLDLHLRDDPQLLEQFQNLVRESSYISNLRWLVTIDELFQDRVQNAQSSLFWRLYGSEEFHATSAPFDLDKGNSRQEVGRQVLIGKDPSFKDEIRNLTLHLSERALDDLDLDHPLLAWTRVDSSAGEFARLDRTDVLDKYLSYVEDYCAVNHPILVSVPSKAVLRMAIHQISMLALQSKGDPVEWSRPPGLSTNESSIALRALRGFGLIGLTENSVGEYTIGLQFASFWANFIAQHLLGSSLDFESLEQEIADWETKAERRYLCESVCSFVYLLSRERAASEGALKRWFRFAISRDRVLSALLDSSLPVSGVSFDAVHQARKRVLKREQQLTPRSIFLLLRFWRLQRSSWKTYQRLEFLQPFYAQVGDCAFSAYFSDGLRELLGVSSLGGRKTFPHIVAGLAGSEHTGAGRLAAELVIGRGARWFDTEADWVSVVERCAGLRSFINSDWRYSTSGDNVNSFGAEFISQWTHFMCSTYGAGSFRRALARWNPQVRGFRGFIQQCWTISAGRHLYNFGDPQSQHAFHGLLRSLVKGHTRSLGLSPVDQKKIAFFMIRHSRQTRGDAFLEVNAELRPLLRELATDRRLVIKLREWGEPLFKANGISFPH